MVVNWDKLGPEPTVRRSTDNDVYTFDAGGAPLVRCIHCGTRTPLWGAPTIWRGHMAPMPNKRYGLRMANGQIDTRRVLFIPMLTKGFGCPVCHAAYEQAQRTAPSGQTAFLPDGVKR